MKNIWKHYFKPSPVWARIIGDISLIIAGLSYFIDLIIPVIQQYTFGDWIEKNKGIVLIALLAVKFLSNFFAKKPETNDSEGKN